MNLIQVFAFMLDNASNNDTMVEGIARRAAEEGIKFSASWACMRCMPHTIYLAAIKLLEAIGALTKSEADKATSRSGNYQDSLSTPLSRAHDKNAARLSDSIQGTDINLFPDASSNIVPAVDKVCFSALPLFTHYRLDNNTYHYYSSGKLFGLFDQVHNESKRG